MISTSDADFSRIANYLQKQRESILTNWRSAVTTDPKVGAAASLARSQFVDHIPRILDAFDKALRARERRDERLAEAEERAGAADHGEQRWLHGYNSRETMREWGHLHICMLQELEALSLAERRIDAATLSIARTMLARLFVDCMVESAGAHAGLERAEAEGRLGELERVLEELRAVDRERMELWREAAHDLRGSVGVVKLAATALGRVVSAPEMPSLLNRVHRGADSMDSLLSDLIELTRLEAGREHREIGPFNASVMVRELCESVQPLAEERRLFLKVDTPPSLLVNGDRTKVWRIAQNLVLNAVKYTSKGGVVVTCAEEISGDMRNWSLSVQDTGVGLGDPADAPLTQAIREATDEAQIVEAEQANAARSVPGEELPTARAATLTSKSQEPPRPGEGIGLSIVKRLCELLDASIELQSRKGSGTTFRITFPTRYPL